MRIFWVLKNVKNNIREHRQHINQKLWKISTNQMKRLTLIN
jgi:hypothetical protein